MNRITSRMSIPTDLSYIKPVSAYAVELARDMGFDEREATHIVLALEETLVNVIQFGYEGQPLDHFDLVFEQHASSLVLRIHEKGVPFNPERLPQYQPDRPDLDESGAGLGLHLIRSAMDEVKFIRQGRQGQEIRLVKHIGNKHIDRLVPGLRRAAPRDEGAAGAPAVQPTDYIIRPMQPEEAVEVSKCAYKCYGYTYEDYVYYPERLAAMNKEGLLLSAVAVTDEGRIMGHAAIKHPHPGAPIAESGVAFVYPEYRRMGLFKKFNEYFIDRAREKALSGLYGRAVTTHVASQRMAAGHGYKDCGLFLGAFPGDVDFKNIGGKTTQRESGVLSFLALGDKEIRNVHVPPGLQSIAADVFRSVNVPVRFASGKTAANSRTEGRFHLEATVNDALNMAEIVVDGYGEDAPDEIHRKHKEMLLRRIDVIHLVLNLEDLGAEEAASQAEALGFFFAGILPFGSNGRHALILQHLNNVRIDVGRIKLFSPEAALILKFIERSGKL